MKVGCPRDGNKKDYIVQVVVQRILVVDEGEYSFSVDQRCRKPNDGSVVYVECAYCGYIVYDYKHGGGDIENPYIQ